MITFFADICELLTQPSSKKEETYASYILGWATYFSELQYRRLIESWYIYLKVDLNIPVSLNQTQAQLLAHVRNKSIFSDEFVAYFSSDTLDPLETDPAQVATIKRLLCALNHLERSCENVLNIDVNPQRYTIALSYDLASNLYSLFSTMTDDLNTINQCSADVELLIGSYMKPLRSKLNTLMKTIDLNNVSVPSVGSTLQLFPEVPDSSNPDQMNQGLGHLSELIYQLPVYFQELQTLMDPASLKNLSMDDSRTLKIKTNTLMRHLKTLATSEGLALLPSGIATVQLLIDQLPTLLNTAGHFTKDSHIKLELVLNQLRHEHFPGIIAELEGVEEHFSLHPNLLIEPTLKSMSRLYSGLASLSDHIETASGLIDKSTDSLNTPNSTFIRGFFGDFKPIKTCDKKIHRAPNHDVMCDNEFITTVQHRRATRWIEADFAQRDTTILKAAERFFQNVSEWSSNHENPVNKIPTDPVNALKNDYKLFQSYYARLYPDLDVLFVNNFSLWLERFDKRQSPISLIKQSIAQEKFKRSLIEKNSTLHDKLYNSTGCTPKFTDLLNSKKNKEHQLNHAVSMSRAKHNHLNASLDSVGDKPEYQPPLYRILSQKPSKKLNDFIQGDLKTWLEKGIDPAIFSALSFDPNDIIKTTVINHEIQSFNNTPSVLFYKKLLCSLAMIQNDLAKLENLYEQHVSPAKLQTAILTDSELWNNKYYATQFLSEAASSPELKEIINKGLVCLEPLKNIPGLGDYLNSIHSKRITEKPLDIDMVASWKAQKELVKQTLSSEEVSEPRPLESGTPLTNVHGSTKTNDVVTQDDILLNIAKQIYKTPELIRKFNLDTQDTAALSEELLTKKASELIFALKLSNCTVETLKQVLLSINELNNALSHIGLEAKSAVMAIEKKLRMDILFSADETEFQLGYRPGTISTPLNETLNHYFRNLMIDFPVSTEEKFELISNTDCIEERIKIERARLTRLPMECHKITKMNHDLVSGYKQLRNARKTMINEELLLAYQTLQPYLCQINMKYDSTLFLRELQHPDDFKKAFDEIQNMKGKLFLLVDQEKNGLNDKERRCQDRINFLKEQKKTQEQHALKVKQAFTVDLQLHTAFQESDHTLNLKLNANMTNHDDPIIRTFQNIVHLLTLKKNPTSKDDNDNFIEPFNSTKSKWNAICASHIRDKMRDTHSEDDIEKMISHEVNQLYSDYFHLIDAHKQLENMREYIEQHPSCSDKIDKDKIYWISTMKESLSKHTIPPKQRLINMAIIGLGKECKSALEKQADHPFIRLVHKLYKLFFGIETPEKHSRIHLQNKINMLINEKKSLIPKDPNKTPPASQ